MDRAYQIAIAALLAFVLGLLFGVLGTRITEHTPIDWPVTAKVVSDTMTALGILAAGAWAFYLIQRRRALEARAELIHRCQVWHRGNDTFLRIFIDIRNPSEVVLQPGDGTTRIQQPPTDDFDSSIGSADNWKDVATIPHHLSSEGVYVEPKESETLCHDVKLPMGVRFLQLETTVACKRTKAMEDYDEEAGPPPELGSEDERWTLNTLVDLKGLSPNLSARFL